MTKKILLMLLIIASSFFMGFTYSSVSSFSNMGTSYKSFYSLTTRPKAPFSFGETTEFEYNNYRNSVKNYIESYNQYLNNCDSDISKIRLEAKNAENDVNLAIKEFNNWSNSKF